MSLSGFGPKRALTKEVLTASSFQHGLCEGERRGRLTIGNDIGNDVNEVLVFGCLAVICPAKLATEETQERVALREILTIELRDQIQLGTLMHVHRNVHILQQRVEKVSGSNHSDP